MRLIKSYRLVGEILEENEPQRASFRCGETVSPVLKEGFPPSALAPP